MFTCVATYSVSTSKPAAYTFTVGGLLTSVDKVTHSSSYSICSFHSLHTLGARYFYDIEDARDFVMGNYFQQEVLGGGGTTVNRSTGTDYVPGAESNDSDFYIFAY